MEPVINFYDLFANGPLMDDLLDDRIDLFSPLVWTLLGITLGAVVLFYYLLNNRAINRSSRFGNLPTWIITLLAVAVMVFAAHAVTLSQMADRLVPRNPGADPKTITYFFDQSGSVFFGFALQVAGLSAVLFFLLSLALKWGSTHAKNVPF
jgi:hypothetical protein